MSMEIRVRKKLRDFELDVDMAVPDGKVLVLLGENGAGKTTVLRMIAGLMSPDEGKIVVDGEVFFDSAAGIDRPARSRRTGYVFQSYALFPHLSVYDNLAFGLRLRTGDEGEIERTIRPLLESYGLWDLRAARASKLSGGQKQRVALLRALVLRPSIFLLDEPVSALDPGIRAAVRRSVRDLAREPGRPMVVVTHDLRDAYELGDVVCVLEKGKVAALGPPSEVLVPGRVGLMDDRFLPGCRCRSAPVHVVQDR